MIIAAIVISALAVNALSSKVSETVGKISEAKDTFKVYVLAQLEEGFYIARNLSGSDFFLLEVKDGRHLNIGERVSIREVYRICSNGKDVMHAIEKPKCYVIAQVKNAMQAQLVRRLDKRFVLASLDGKYILLACTPQEQTKMQKAVTVTGDLTGDEKDNSKRKSVNVLMLPVCDDGSVLPLRKHWLA